MPRRSLILPAVVALVGTAACGGDEDAEPRLLAGSPDATRALAFTAGGRPVAIGGTSAFGLAFLQHQDGDTWVRAPLVPGFGSRAQLSGGGTTVPLLALDDTTLYRLIDETAMTWDGITIPVGASSGTAFGTDANGVVYALDLAGGDGNGAVISWMPGSMRWTEVAGTRPMGSRATGFVVEPSGRVTWFVPDQGIVRAEAGSQTTIVACADLGDCVTPMTFLTYDDHGTLTALVCAPDAPARFAIRLADGAAAAQVPLPSSITQCHGAESAADGTTLLAGSDDASDGLLALLAPGSTTWRRVAAATVGVRYRLRDRSTAFGFGDAQPERGIHQLDLP